MRQWCERCVKDTPSKPCRILGLTLAYNTRDKEYPSEWIEEDDGPRCTAFSDHRPPRQTIIKDKRQTVMPF
jgi:hypothetical protein